MAKRKAKDSGEHGRSSKKRKPSPLAPDYDAQLPINDANELIALLSFRKDEVRQMHSNILRLGAFVKHLNDHTDPASKRNKDILIEFLRLAGAKDDDDESVVCPSIFQIWSHANHVNNTSLTTAIPLVLADLIRAISQWEDITSYGRHLCKTLLIKDHLSLIEHGLLPSQQHPEQVASHLRLLTELVSYDFGSFARALYRNGPRVFALAEACLSPRLQRKASTDGPLKVREAAIRFVLSNLRFQASQVKAELIGQFQFMKNIFQGIEKDSTELATRVIQHSQRHVLQDTNLSPSARSLFLAPSTLIPLAKLSRLRNTETSQDHSDIRNQSYDLLMTECLKDSNEAAEHAEEKDRKDADAKSYDNFPYQSAVLPGLSSSKNEKCVIRRAALAALLQELRVDINLRDRKLALGIFQKHPRTVPEYFNLRRSQYFDPPKLTTTWLGHATFLTDVLRLPVAFNHAPLQSNEQSDAATVEDLVDSIVPKTLGQEVLERCFNQKSELIMHLAIQIVSAALHRFKEFRHAYRSHLPSFKSHDATLGTAFCRRCPRGTTILAAYKRCRSDQSLLRHALARLLRSCYDTVPQLVVSEKMDVSKTVAKILQEGSQDLSYGVKSEMEKEELESFMWIASEDPSVKWFNKPDALKLSAFTTILQTASQDLSYRPAGDLLVSIAKDKCIVQEKDTRSAIIALLTSLSPHAAGQVAPAIFEFIDNCMFYLDKRAIKYIGMLYQFIDTLDLRRDKEDKTFSPIVLAILDQWKFFSGSPAETFGVARWISLFMDSLDDIGENRAMLRAVRDGLVESTEDADAREVLLATLPSDKQMTRTPKKPTEPPPATVRPINSSHPQITAKDVEELKQTLDVELEAQAEADDHPELTRWQGKDLEDAIDDGHVTALLLCLSSQQAAVRREALHNVRLLKTRLAPFKLAEDKAKVTLGLCYWIVGQVVETVEQHSASSAESLPRIVPAFAGRALAITRQPGHFLFAKVNKFVDARPWWTPGKLPRQWVERIVWQAPERANNKWNEALWLIELLQDGLRARGRAGPGKVGPGEAEPSSAAPSAAESSSAGDAALYFHANVFEPLLGAWGAAPAGVRAAIARLLYAYAAAPGGARTLVTRFAVVPWMRAALARPAVPLGVQLLLRCLAARLAQLAGPDRDAIDNWSAGRFGRQVEALRDGRMGDFF